MLGWGQWIVIVQDRGGRDRPKKPLSSAQRPIGPKCKLKGY